MKKIEAIIRKTKFEDVKEALLAADIEWFSYYDVRGEGKMRQARIYRGVMYNTSCIERVLLNIVVRDKNVERTVATVQKAAYTGDEIVEICSDKRPLLIISEMMLPKQDAIQVYRTLQKTTDTINIPFIIVSSLKNEDAVKSSYALGINFFLKKPYMIAELTGLSQNIIRGNKIES